MRRTSVIGAGTLLSVLFVSAGHSADVANIPLLPKTPSVFVTRGPYLQMGSSTAVTLRWRTNQPTDSYVRSGTDLADLNDVAFDVSSTTEHEILVEGLSPGTKYYYSVGDATGSLAGGFDSYYFVTSPPTGAAKPTRIWALGDSGLAGASAEAVRDAFYDFNGGTHPDLWLMLGDNAYGIPGYGDGSQVAYQVAVFDRFPRTLRTSVLWPTIGNHEWVSSFEAIGPYFDMFTLPKNGEAGGEPSGFEGYYSFDYGNIHFICLDSNDGILMGSSPDPLSEWGMIPWLESDLAATDQDWIVAFFHHPPYSKGGHDSDRERNLILMRDNALPVLERGGVDLVLSGHSHSYERSFLIDGHYGKSSTLVSANILDSGNGNSLGDGAYRKYHGTYSHNGTVYAVCGSSSRLTEGSLDHPVMATSQLRMGSMVIDIDGDRLDARFLDIHGEVEDSFTILKRDELSENSSWIRYE
ncbi:MAG: metallophosphoesterase family protein [Candidatus Omnitrophica bacterium]|nr:metallophosphoesterase family protein [Candidatus Omnitrophota bacterium]